MLGVCKCNVPFKRRRHPSKWRSHLAEIMWNRNLAGRSTDCSKKTWTRTTPRLWQKHLNANTWVFVGVLSSRAKAFWVIGTWNAGLQWMTMNEFKKSDMISWSWTTWLMWFRASSAILLQGRNRTQRGLFPFFALCTGALAQWVLQLHEKQRLEGDMLSEKVMWRDRTWWNRMKSWWLPHASFGYDSDDFANVHLCCNTSRWLFQSPASFCMPLLLVLT